ncbi:NADPH-dependent 2,4-dienoyl-CoA reductase, sulfur reductase [Alkalithermobacter thermoalcaliphilus JW-YL-7 = DSM 7308]|uniref:NADH peroxidase n=1 Tax=Alkalithermobacter thermoalcaliphilus JW-YL-7 = DSM 7308 TaxID=1121328 RepID=A0A150FP03_CLOPD|nr:NADH peroxidase [[Clostridium] paradoxum JW-YL-7 = DSM 7308]SHK54503.1 NADPH-dependent 2,4-dienoyl-CoA reductase, sulfur reductase [[Clostridium] paradoxum JW-YL-7 = DSM 7308]
MKVTIIGCTHAGTAAILNINKLYPNAQITVYEKNDTISFLSCGIALYVGGIVKDPKKLFYSSPEHLQSIGVNTKMSHEVIDVDIDNKKIKAKDLKTNEEVEDTFDKLIITTGSWPIVPNIEGIDMKNIVLSKNYYHSNDIIKKSKDAKNVVVVGAGYIGVELVEAFEMNGKNVTLIDTQDRILSKYLDKEYTDMAESALKDKGIKLALGETVTKFEGKDGKVTKVITDKGEHSADLVILCIGFRPNTILFKDKVQMLPNGAIIVDEYMRTSKEDVYAAGDCCSVIYNPTGTHEYIPLATNAVRMGTLVAKNLVRPTTKYMGTQGTSGIKIYDYNIASTGITENYAKERGMNVESVVVTDNYRPEFMPTYDEAKLKVVYEEGSRRIVGAQIISKADLTQSINTISVCIQNNMTIDELAFVDFFFQPHYNKPWNLLNLAGLSANEKTL